MNQFTFRPQGVCSQLIEIETEGNIIQDVRFTGGCNGNLQGISALLKGMTVENAIDRLSGIRCGFKDTSCPDQLSRALKAMQEQA
ncbi:MAG: TIGR03905 family TSCPD domain-containing protein [Clostridia bacterium]|uniref:ribonucleoside-diphosphate reductase n=1 Tax=Mogibacterium kristiansenii TaxID=2606708 RepID=A0A6N7X8K8_9FIRM|nr:MULTISPECIES: TIGR03905 family TSCPD domain-containing protein [Mogibacterium]MDY5450803.1 TIGR03905 family TSCPD domain-containing protein [Clostridia bacterium]MCI7123735.1 TIGR03905 family TSCPD domain-containing protein [Mogibacterium sp.]MDD6700813.1 TIGR03905 family TSCPD domain-containing protein [Mogibacterium kristiansenii]MEE0370076.1 TIGR03905 family TSCPD domain-containing protein [Clostridia bacterium]MEE1375163.1 TIGR03905 family TSCPD domain-containing protein [Clostridia bac